jgi:predicted secreted hydrolase
VSFDRWLLQFDQGDALVLLQTRRRDASATPSARAVWISADGQIQTLDSPVARVQTVATPVHGSGAWNLTTLDGRTRLQVEATTESTDDRAADQGPAVSVRVGGQHDGQPVTGWGIVDVGSP